MDAFRKFIIELAKLTVRNTDCVEQGRLPADYGTFDAHAKAPPQRLSIKNYFGIYSKVFCFFMSYSIVLLMRHSHSYPIFSFIFSL